MGVLYDLPAARVRELSANVTVLVRLFPLISTP